MAKQEFIFGEWLKEKRKESGLTQKELAEKLNMTRAIIILWEKGVCSPNFKTYQKLQKLFRKL